MLFPIIIVGGAGLLAGIILVVAAKVMSIPVDEMLEAVRAELPGANCGGCGYAGCDDYAKAVAHDGAKTNLCPVGGAEVAQKLSEVLGVDFSGVEQRRAVVRCSGTCSATSDRMDYQGVQSCAACNHFYQGKGNCSYGCMGFGDCERVCQYGAISIVDGIAVVNESLCVACGMCVDACPKQLIAMISSPSRIFVGCRSHDKGAVTRKACTAGCIACKKCEKACAFDAIHVTDNLAEIDPAKCTNCGACVGQCPTKVIVCAPDGAVQVAV